MSIQNQPALTIRIELAAAIKYISLLALFIWLPFVHYVIQINPLTLIVGIRTLQAIFMFFTGAVIANATAVGGGIVFNPMLQLVFGVSGISALVLAITVQCSGMASGTYGWFKRGEFSRVKRAHLLLMGVGMSGVTALSTLLLLEVAKHFPREMLVAMKIASAFVSFYVFWILWKHIRKNGRPKARVSSENTPTLSPSSLTGPSIDPAPVDLEDTDLKVDRRMVPWIFLGALLNTYTAVGAGELVFSHLIKYYNSPAKRAVAVGALMQAVSVWTQTVFIVIYLREYLILDLVSIGLLFTMIGGRMAPLIMTRPYIEPYAKHALAFTALGMGLTSSIMLLR